MRISGSQEDINDLGNAFQEHPSLARMCLFNIDLVDQSNGRTLVPVVEGIKRNPKLIDVALRYLRWAPSILGDMVDENSIIKTLRLTGKMTFSDIGPERLSRSLRTNTFLKELAINRCDLPKGAEFTISEFLAYNTSLQTFIIELHNFREAIPFAEVLGTSNRILKKIDITCKQRFDPVEFGGGRRRRVGRMNIDNDDDSSNNGSSPPETKKEKEDAIESCKLAFEKTLEENTSLHSVVLTDEVNSNPISITSEKVEMFLTLNRAGRKHLLRNDNLLSSQLMRFITKHNDDPNIVFYTFTTKPNLLAQIIDACTQAAVKARKNGKLQDFGTRVQEMIDNNAHMNRRRTLADEIMSSAMLSNDEKVGMYQKLILDHKKEPPRKKLRLSMQL